MRVKLEEIQDKGLSVTDTVSPKVLQEALDGAEGFTLASAGKLKADFNKVSGRVHLAGAIDLDLSGTCKRCTTNVPLALPVRFKLRMVEEAHKPYVPVDAKGEGKAGKDDAKGNAKTDGKGKGHHAHAAHFDPKSHEAPEDDDQAHQGGSFDLDAVDAEPFDGKSIDLDPIVREQVLLALPVSVLCKEDCKGLCPTCGQDLNEKNCGHEPTRAESPFAKLKDFKLN